MRRAFKMTAWAACAFALLLIVVVGALWIFANTTAGRSAIEKLTYRITGGTVHIAGLAGSIPRHLTLERLELRDSRGVWLTGKKNEVDWSTPPYINSRPQ